MAGRLQEPGNARVLSVTEFTQRVKAVLEAEVVPGWVRGEVSNLREQASGHVYFSLKDAGAQLSAVMFRQDAARQSLRLRDGLQVLGYGGINVYPAHGKYQLIVRAVLADGEGRLQQEFEALKRRLSAEGLFEPARRKAIPALPAAVGVVTSPTGAAVQDFLRILRRRDWRGRVVVLPCKVQGVGSAEEMAVMLEHAAGLGLFDLLVLTRGGGSLEDLWAFNEEVLVRAVAACPLPVISAVGHEIDFTLCDFAADARAETPSAAAEMISSRFVEALERCERAEQGLSDAVTGSMDAMREQLERLRTHLRLLSPRNLIEQGYLRLDDWTNRLTAVLCTGVQARRQRSVALEGRFVHHAPELRVQTESQRLLALGKRLQSASPAAVLNRGFAIVRDAAGRPQPRKAGLRGGDRLQTEFADGILPVRVD